MLIQCVSVLRSNWVRDRLEGNLVGLKSQAAEDLAYVAFEGPVYSLGPEEQDDFIARQHECPIKSRVTRWM
jgi:hypothetical protein